MNEKIQAILLKIILDLKKENWIISPDWQITLRSEGHAPLKKDIPVDGTLGDDEWNDKLETHIDLKLITDDQFTYFPEYTVNTSIFIEGGTIKDVVHKMTADFAFTDHDYNNADKAGETARKISRLVENFIEEQYAEYINENSEQITDYKNGAWEADNDSIDDR